jgi:uncharacterized membrane protein
LRITVAPFRAGRKDTGETGKWRAVSFHASRPHPALRATLYMSASPCANPIGIRRTARLIFRMNRLSAPCMPLLFQIINLSLLFERKRQTLPSFCCVLLKENLLKTIGSHVFLCALSVSVVNGFFGVS